MPFTHKSHIRDPKGGDIRVLKVIVDRPESGSQYLTALHAVSSSDREATLIFMMGEFCMNTVVLFPHGGFIWEPLPIHLSGKLTVRARFYAVRNRRKSVKRTIARMSGRGGD